jgi:uncharacterized protein
MATSDFRVRLGNVRLKDTSAMRTMALGDSLSNVITGLGGGLDASTFSRYQSNYISQDQVDNAFRTSGFARKIHTIPATDATRAWRSWQADDADIGAIEAEERRLGLQGKVRKAEIVSRMYGGSVILMGTADGELREPLDVTRVGKGYLRYLHVISRHRVQVQSLDLDPGSPFYGQPSEYILTGGNGAAIPVHPSRVVRFVNGDMPDDILEQNSGWADPLLMSLWSQLTNADTVQNTFAGLIPKAMLDTVYIPGLTEMAATQEGEDRLKRRFVVAKLFESTLGVKLMDAASTKDGVGEKWDTRQITWANMPELMTAFIQMLAGVSDIPMTRLAGMSPGGMNSTGDSDTENYLSNVSAQQELSLRPRMDMIDEVLVRSALGEMPKGLWFRWNPLRVDSEETRAKNAKARAEATKVYADTGTVPMDVLEKAVRGQLIESGEYPGIEGAYREHDEGLETPEIDGENDNTPIPAEVQPATRLAAANDTMRALLDSGMGAMDAFTEAQRLTDAAPRTLYVSRRVLNVDDLTKWAREQGLPPLQSDLHVTIAFSRTPVDWISMGSTWHDASGKGRGDMVIAEGGPRVVEPLGSRTAVLMFASSDLSYRNLDMRERGASWDWDDYQAHISLTGEPVDLSNVTPYRGIIHLGPEIFEEIQE